MYNLFRFIGVRHLVTKPWRTILATLGVSLGIALYVAIQLINHSTTAAFRESIESIAGRSKLTVAGGDTGFSESLVTKLQKFPGVRSAVPLVVSRAYIAGAADSSESLMVLGVDLLKEEGVRSYRTTDQEVIEDPFTFLNQPDSIILTKAFAQKRGLKIDSRFEIATAHGPRTMTVRGLLEPEGPAKAYGGNLAIMDIDGARVTFGKVNKVDRVDLVLREGVNPANLAKALAASMGPGFTVEDASAQSEGMSKVIASYQTLLDLFSVLALFVGVFLITNTVNISVAERRKEIGTLRSLGTLRKEIMVLFLSEAVLMGLWGSFVGVWLGWGMASLLVDLVAHSMSIEYATPIQPGEIVFGWSQILRGMAIGGGAAFVAALYPAIRSVTIQPMDAMKRIDEGEESMSSQKTYGLLFGAALLAYLAVSSLAGWSAHAGMFKILDPVAAMAGVALVSPFAVLAIVHLLQRAHSRLSGKGGAISRLAHDNLIRNPKRTGSNVRILMVGLTLVIILSSLSGSFKGSIVGWYDRTLNADLVVSSFGSIVANQVQPIDENIGKELEKLSGLRGDSVRSAYAIRSIHFQYGGKQLSLKAYDETNPADRYSNFEVLDRPTFEAVQDLYHSSDLTALVSENFSRNFHKKTGDTIEMDSPSGPVKLRIVGVASDFSSPEGLIYLDRKQYRNIWQDHLVDGFALFAQPGYDPERIRAEIDHRFARSLNLTSVTQGEIKKQVSERIDNAFSYTHAIEAAALLVAMLGLLNTFLISVMERTQELGVLRAIGMSRRQVQGLILQEAFLQGSLGSGIAVLLGTLAAYFLVTYSLSRLLGWVLYFSIPWSSLALTMVLGIAVAMLAGIYPSIRASRIEISEALEYE
ncbi:MAG: ABC transporter permease [Bdellovibrionota bacterium]